MASDYEVTRRMKSKKHVTGAVKDGKGMKKKNLRNSNVLSKPCDQPKFKPGVVFIPDAVLKANFMFMVECDDAEDCKEIVAALSRKTTITWNYDTKEAMIHFDPQTRTLLVSKSINKIPKPIRL